ncbi:hypothetical protein THAOC_19650 [Thalassiosira oceanica]|uniref:Uncharacterized protein n=1 Tax=Thalassiosira oceanica TaxID=159749 RepID=K0SNQ2_THAOC|nr:hypothetical protein THAOC_19650 [Thalassiosira oceanica]|eukprot:EJK60067.1 hypothetical protein THAOC_19650 [Thalassiosira oceanica]
MKDGSADDSVPNEDENNETWRTGLRQRRRNSNGHRADDANSHRGNRNREPGQGNSSNTPPNVLGPGFGSNAGACSGVGAGGVGLLSSTSGANLPTDAGPSTPLKPSDNNGGGKDLVAVTPGSMATQMTAQSTLFDDEPIDVRRRSALERGRSRRQSSHSLSRQYRLLRSQTLLLFSSASLGLLLFLFYALPLAAFVSLGLLVTSLGALVPVGQSALRSWYELQMQHPLGLTRYLPDSLRIYLTETSLHEFMSEGTFFLDYRYLLLYFMPLTDEQLNHYINQLPPRHRDSLLQPGLGRMLPGVMDNFMRLDIDSSSDAVQADTNDEHVPLMLENRGDASVSSGLTNVDETEDASVSLVDVIVGLGSTLATAASNNLTAPLSVIAEEHSPAPPGEAALAENSNNIAIDNTRAEQDDSGSSFDFSVDIDAQGLPDIEGETPAVSGVAETDVPLQNNRNRRDQAPADQTTQDEYDLEGRILTEAATTVASNIRSQASSAAADGAMEVVQAASGWVVNAGTITGLLAGGGGIVAAVISSQPVVLGALVRASTNAGSSSLSTRAQANVNGGADDSSGPSPNRASQWMQGLFATSAFGFASAGFAYFVRGRVRAAIAAKREKRQVEDEKKPSDIGT